MRLADSMSNAAGRMPWIDPLTGKAEKSGRICKEGRVFLAQAWLQRELGRGSAPKNISQKVSAAFRTNQMKGVLRTIRRT
jgi:hypothetical protein